MSRKVTGEHIVIGQLLDQIRDYYIDYFIDTINEYAETNGGAIFHEVALCKADGSLATAGVLGQMGATKVQFGLFEDHP